MKERLQRFSALSSEARELFLRAALLLPLIALSLRVRGFRFTQMALWKFSFQPRAGFGAGERLLDGSITNRKKALIARMVRAAVRHSPRTSTCLEESLALWFLLICQGITCDMRIGTRKVAGNFEAHAWVECDGEALNETQEVSRRYAVFEPVRCLMEAR